MTSKGHRSHKTKEKGHVAQVDKKWFIKGPYKQKHVLGGCRVSRSL